MYESKGTILKAEPSESFEINCTVNYNHPFLKEQQIDFVVTPENFLKEISPARTFCFDYEIEVLKNKGLAKGGDFSNAIVVGLNGIHNPGDSLRFENEFVRHKTLDIIGDLYLLGHSLKAKITAEKTRTRTQYKICFKNIRNCKINRIIKIEESKAMSETKKVIKTLDINAIKKAIPPQIPFSSYR